VNVRFRSSFAKDLRAIKDQGLLNSVKEAIEQVEKAPSVQALTTIKRLKGGGNYYRIRIRDYRLGLVVEGDVATFIRCLDRKQIYRYFP
jgi:mRNA interferase RelE/StbE